MKGLKLDFINKSYEAHEANFTTYTSDAEILQEIKTVFEPQTLDDFRHARFWALADPIIEIFTTHSWLTIGDGRYAKDAVYLKSKGVDVIASDISTTLVKKSYQLDCIDKFSKINAEDIDLPDQSMDVLYCKEAFHHFPRPMLGLYEMLRVAKHSVVLIEPRDHTIDKNFVSSLFLNLEEGIRRITGRCSNRNSFERVGNYVHKISLREIEKMALSMGLKKVYYKEFNDAFNPAYSQVDPYKFTVPFMKFWSIIAFKKLTNILKIRPSSHLCIVLVKETTPDINMDYLDHCGFKILYLESNPYL
jgi:SAM-dependent methyltransferase